MKKLLPLILSLAVMVSTMAMISLRSLAADDDIVIPWCKIECIGEDTILVRLTVEECRRIDDGKKRSWKL